MEHASPLHHRRSIRLKGYDYSQGGGYYLTLVTSARRCIFGEIVADVMRLNELGAIVQECWEDILDHFPHVTVDVFAVMPNHVHGILFLHDDGRGLVYSDDGRGTKVPFLGIYSAPAPRESQIEQFGKPTIGSIPTILRAYKAAVTRRAGRELNSANIWQRNYNEHILRGQADYERVAGYVLTNPSNWYNDDENPNKHS